MNFFPGKTRRKKGPIASRVSHKDPNCNVVGWIPFTAYHQPSLSYSVGALLFDVVCVVCDVCVLYISFTKMLLSAVKLEKKGVKMQFNVQWFESGAAFICETDSVQFDTSYWMIHTGYIHLKYLTEWLTFVVLEAEHRYYHMTLATIASHHLLLVQDRQTDQNVWLWSLKLNCSNDVCSHLHIVTVETFEMIGGSICLSNYL